MRRPTVRQAAAFTFWPVQRRDVSDLGWQWGATVRSIARLYLQAGLIGGEHPALQPGANGWRGGCGMGAVLREATRTWRQRWGASLAGAWQAGAGDGLTGSVGGVIEAVAAGRRDIVTDSMLVAVGWLMWSTVWLGIAWAITTGLIGTAHAAAAKSDIARSLMGELFPFFGSATVLAEGLGKMAGIMGTVACALVGLGALYGVVLQVVEYNTNYERAKGQYDPVIFALRVTIAFTLAVPLATGWGLGQVLVGQAAAWGSDKASEAWVAAVSYLGDGRNWVAKPGVARADVEAVIGGVLRAEICKAAWNEDPRGGARIGTVTATDGSWRYDLFSVGTLWAGTEEVGKCGIVTFPKSDNKKMGAVAKGVYDAHREAFGVAAKGVASEVGPLVDALWKCKDKPLECTPAQSPDKVKALVDTYQTTLDTKIREKWVAENSQTAKTLATEATEGGWIAAGKWAMSLSKLQGSLAAAGTTLPVVSGPTGDFDKQTSDVMEAAMKWATVGMKEASAAKIKPQSEGSGGLIGAMNWAFTTFTDGLWSMMFEVDTLQPLAAISTVGYVLYMTGLLVLGGLAAVASETTKSWLKWGVTKVAEVTSVAASAGGTAPTVGAKWGAEMFSDIIAQLMPFFTAVCGALIVVGMALAYFVPALPFIRFLFAVLGWLMSLVETILLTPIMLVLMVTADAGGGILGPLAKAAFWNIIGLLVRPIMTVMGFVLGLMLINVAVGLVNSLMLPWMRDWFAGGSGIIGPIGFLAYGIIYFFVIYGMVNAITKMPEMLPVAAYRWIGANAAGDRDDAGNLAGMTGAFMNRIMGGTGKIGEKQRK